MENVKIKNQNDKRKIKKFGESKTFRNFVSKEKLRNRK